ncbi:MAG: DUF6212 domain-containing protein [Synechococcus sp.]
MPKERRTSLARLVGLKESTSAKISHKGGIDNIQPGRLSGWVAANGIIFHEVRLLVCGHLLAKTEVDQLRPDVCEMLGSQAQHGFIINLPSKLPIVNWQEEPRLIAMSADGSNQVELGLLGQKKPVGKVLKDILQSDLLGLIGHCDGVIQGAIRGWAARNGQTKPTMVWLQREGKEPRDVYCDQHREGMQSQNVPSNCGFVVSLQSMPSEWAGSKVWFSFDRDGEFLVPQASEIILPGEILTGNQPLKIDRIKPTSPAVLTESYLPILESAPDELAIHLQKLELHRRHLDQLEKQLCQIERGNSFHHERSQQIEKYHEQISDIGPKPECPELDVRPTVDIIEGNDFLLARCNCWPPDLPTINMIRNYLHHNSGLVYIMLSSQALVESPVSLGQISDVLLELSGKSLTTEATLSRIRLVSSDIQNMDIGFLEALIFELVSLNSRNASLLLETSTLRSELERVQNAFVKTQEFLHGSFAHVQNRHEAYKTPMYGESFCKVSVRPGECVFQSLPVLSSGVNAIVLISSGTDGSYSKGLIEFELLFLDGSEQNRQWSLAPMFFNNNRFIELALPFSLPVEGLAMKLRLSNHSTCTLAMEGHPPYADETLNLQPHGRSPLSLLIFTGMPLVRNIPPDHAVLCA